MQNFTANGIVVEPSSINIEAWLLIAQSSLEALRGSQTVKRIIRYVSPHKATEINRCSLGMRGELLSFYWKCYFGSYCLRFAYIHIGRHSMQFSNELP